MRTFLFLFLLASCGMASAQSFVTGTYSGSASTPRQYDFRNDGTFALTYFDGNGAEPFVAEGTYRVTRDSIAGVDSLKLDFASCDVCRTGRAVYFVNGVGDTLAVVRLYNESLNGAGWQGRINMTTQRNTSFDLKVVQGGEQLFYRTHDIHVNDIVTLALPGNEPVEIPIQNTSGDAYVPYRTYTWNPDVAVAPIGYRLADVTASGIRLQSAPGDKGSVWYDRVADADGTAVASEYSQGEPVVQRPRRELKGLKTVLDITFFVLRIAIDVSLSGGFSSHSYGSSHDTHFNGRTRGR